MEDLDFEDLNPAPDYDDRGDVFFGCLTLLLLLGGIRAAIWAVLS